MSQTVAAVNIGGTGQTTGRQALTSLATWVTGVSYSVGQEVTYGGQKLVCFVAHTSSGTLAADVALGKWDYANQTAHQSPNLMLSGTDFEDNTVGGWSPVNFGPLTNGLPYVTSNNGATLQTGQYIFTITAASASNGATYTNNGITFTVIGAISSGTVLVCTGSGAPTASGTLTYVSGSPSGNITFSAVTNTAKSSSLTAPAATSSSPIDGVYSLNLATSGSNAAGDGYVSQLIPISTAYQAKVLTLKFKYKVASGTPVMAGTSSNTYAVAAYDVTNNTWLGMAGNFNLVQSTGVGDFIGTLQTGATTANIQIFIYFPVAASGVSSLLLDNFYLGQQASTLGPAVIDWQTYTVTITGSTSNPTKGTTTKDQGYWRQVGDSIEIRYEYTQTGAGSAGSGTYQFSIPTALTIDTTKITDPGTSNASSVGSGSAFDGTSSYVVNAYPTTTTTLGLFWTSGVIGSTLVPLSNATARFGFHATVPIVGKSSNSVMSQDTDTRVVSFSANKIATQSVTASVTNITFPTVSKDTHGAWNGTDTYTIPVSGDYYVSAPELSDNAAAAVVGLSLYVNTVLKRRVSFSAVAGTASIGATLITGLNAGDTLTLRSTATVTLSAGGTFTINRLSGPAVVAATESVELSYYGYTSGITGTTAATVIHATKVKDTHNQYASGVYTIPVSGMYQVNAGLLLATSGTPTVGTTIADITVVQAGSNTQTLENKYYVPTANTTIAAAGFPLTIQGQIYCLAGDTLKVQGYVNLATASAAASNTMNFFSITRIGN